MRTTVNINDRLFQLAKLRAAESNRTLASVIEDALWLALEAKAGSTNKAPFKVPVSGSGGVMPGVDLDSTTALLDLMEDRK